MRTVLSVIGIVFVFTSLGQHTPATETERFYQFLNEGDSIQLESFFLPGAFVKHVEGDTSYSFDVASFMGICPKFKSGMFKEEIEIIQSSNEFKSLHTVEVAFRFFLNGKFHHCGTDILVWSYSPDKGYKIESIYSSDNDCLMQPPEEIGASPILELEKLMLAWHNDAAEGNFKSYFGVMTSGFYFLGTDPGERWSKDEFAKFCEPHFEDGAGWDFKTIERNWYTNDDNTVAWFDEKLSTWMLDCRGTGVWKLEDGEWKIAHYCLTVLIENDKIEKFIKLRKK